MVTSGSETLMRRKIFAIMLKLNIVNLFSKGGLNADHQH